MAGWLSRWDGIGRRVDGCAQMVVGWLGGCVNTKSHRCPYIHRRIQLTPQRSATVYLANSMGFYRFVYLIYGILSLVFIGKSVWFQQV